MPAFGCFNCYYLSKKPGTKASFIFECKYWGLITERVLPQSVIINSIGKKCPFFKEIIKEVKTQKKEKKTNQNENLDITI